MGAVINITICILMRTGNTDFAYLNNYYNYFCRQKGGCNVHIRKSVDFLFPVYIIVTFCIIYLNRATGEKSMKDDSATSYQFMRLGYFCRDSKSSTPEHLVYNRSISLKDGFKKIKFN